MFFFNDFVGSIIIKFQLDTVKYDKCLNAEALFFSPHLKQELAFIVLYVKGISLVKILLVMKHSI